MNPLQAPPFLSESQRYEYPLTESSVVVDAGGYEGTWTKEIQARYRCRVIIFEPVMKYAQRLSRDFGDRVTVVPKGLAADDRMQQIHIQNNSSGMFGAADIIELCPMYDVTKLLARFALPRIDLLKLNVEGMEYEILEALIRTEQVHLFTHLQIQFHANDSIPDYEERHRMIRERLSATHDCTWNTDFIWCNYSLR